MGARDDAVHVQCRRAGRGAAAHGSDIRSRASVMSAGQPQRGSPPLWLPLFTAMGRCCAHLGPPAASWEQRWHPNGFQLENLDCLTIMAHHMVVAQQSVSALSAAATGQLGYLQGALEGLWA